MKKAFLVLILILSHFLIFSQNSVNISTKDVSLFDRALQYYALEKYDLAHELFKDYTTAFPSQLFAIDAQYYMAACVLYQGNAQGELLIKNFTDRYPNHPKSVYANYDLGSYYFRLKNYEQAIRYLSEVNLVKLDENNRLECNFKLGYAYMTTKNFEKAGTVFQRIKTTKNKYTYAANYYLGYIYYKKELYDAAISHLKKASENQAYKPLVPQVMVNVLNKQKRYDTLIAYSEKVQKEIENLKNTEEIYLLTAEAYMKKEQWKKSIEYFDKYKQLNTGPLADNISFRYALCQFKLGQYNAAIDILKPVAEKNDTLGQASAYYLALSWLRLKNKPFAFNAFHQARRMNFNEPMMLQSTLEYTRLGLDLQKYDVVIEAGKDFLHKYPHTEEAMEIGANMSEAYLYTHDYNAAIKHIEGIKNRTGSINRTYQQVTFYKGVELYNEGNYLGAIELLEKSQQHDYDKETTILCHFFLGEAYSSQKAYDNAIANYGKVLKFTTRIKPDIVARNYYGLGFAHYNKKEYARALPYFKDFIDESKVISDKSLLCDGYLRMADCYYAVKKLKEAENFYTRAIDHQCTDLDYAYFQRGIVQGAQNKDTEAKNSLRYVTQYFVNSPYYYDALYNYGLIDFERTRYETSMPAFSEIINAGKSPVYIPLALQKRAIGYNNLKLYDKSAQDYKTILAEFPTHRVASSAVLGLQEAMSHLGKSNEMDTVLKAYKEKNPSDANIEKVEFETAKNLYFNQTYQEAISKLEKYLVDYPSSANSPDANYFLADSYLRMNDPAQAKKYFEFVIDENKSGFTNKALLKLADLNMESQNYPMAIKNYLKLASTASNKKDVSNAWNGLMLCYFETKDYDSSSFYAQKLIANGGTSITFTNRAKLYLAKNALAEEDEKSLDYLVDAANFSQDQYGAEATYLLASQLVEDKKYKQSLEILFDIDKNFSSYTKWVGKAFLLIADNYALMNEVYQAKATLVSIIENAKETDLIQQAKEKLEKLEAQ